MNFHKGFVITQPRILFPCGALASSSRGGKSTGLCWRLTRPLKCSLPAIAEQSPPCRGQAGTKGWPPMATAVMPASCEVSLPVNSSSSSRMKIGPRVRARTFRTRYLACPRPRAACGRHRILHPVSFTSGSPDTILGAGETGLNPATVPNLWGSSPGDSTAARYSRRAPTPARAGLRKGGPAFCRKDRLCSVVHSHLFESCKRYGKPARLGRSCP